jgi:hypothetical protein
MEQRVPGIQPSSLSDEELLKYAHLENNHGLSKDWCDALITRLSGMLDEVEFFKKELEVQEQLVSELEDALAVLRNQ